jgi:thiamine-phosphate pyrophosphorylase
MRLPPSPFLYPVLDAGLLAGREVGAVVAALAGAGCSLLQVRAKELSDARLVRFAREAVLASHAGGAHLLVNDRPDVALIVGADGVHLGQEDLSPADARALLPPGSIVGVSTHDLGQLRAALREPVDYVALGPVFATRTKARPDPVVGTEMVREARQMSDRPLVAIGGIEPDNAAEVVRAGADGLAVISALLLATDLGAAVRAFAAALGGAR